MSPSGAVDITELALIVEFADTMPAINEKDLVLLVDDNAGCGVSEDCVFGWTEHCQHRDENCDSFFHPRGLWRKFHC